MKQIRDSLSRLVSLRQLAADLQAHLKKSSEQFLKRNVNISKIPMEDLAVLCKYFSIGFTAALFGADDKKIRLPVNTYIKEQILRQEEEEKDIDFAPVDPKGIGGWRYAHRLGTKVIRELERVVSSGAGQGLQLVNASKLLMQETNKTKEESIELMEAYEKQLLLLAEFIVETFLPTLGRRLKKELKAEKSDIISVIKHADPKKRIEAFEFEMDRFIRQWGLKKFELMFSELLAKRKEISEAFNFTTDMIETFQSERYVALEDESAMLIKQSQTNN